MVPTKIEQAVVQAFGLQSLGAGLHTIENQAGEILNRFLVNSLWIIEFYNYFWTPVTLAGLELSILQGDEEIIQYKGLLLLPPVRPPRDRDFAGLNPLQTIDMDWPDTITKCLQNMNVLPRLSTLVLGAGNYDYSVHTYASGGTASFNYQGVPQSKNIEEFCEAIVTTIKWMAKVRGDKEISEIIDKGQNFLSRM